MYLFNSSSRQIFGNLTLFHCLYRSAQSRLGQNSEPRPRLYIADKTTWDQQFLEKPESTNLYCLQSNKRRSNTKRDYTHFSENKSQNTRNQWRLFLSHSIFFSSFWPVFWTLEHFKTGWIWFRKNQHSSWLKLIHRSIKLLFSMFTECQVYRPLSIGPQWKA